MIVRLLHFICQATPVMVTPVELNQRDSILWFSDSLGMLRAVLVRK